MDVRIKTQSGEIGVIKGAEGSMLKVWFAEKKKYGYQDPDDVDYLGFELK